MRGWVKERDNMLKEVKESKIDTRKAQKSEFRPIDDVTVHQILLNKLDDLLKLDYLVYDILICGSLYN
jgi:hypothetical protein